MPKLLIVKQIDATFSYSKYGDFSIIIMHENGYINASKLCYECDKQFKNWLRNSTSKDLIEEFRANGISADKLMIIIAGGKNIKTRGTYVHPKLIIHIASWCGANFAARVSEWIEEWKNYSPENESRFYAALSEIKPSPSASKEKEIQATLHKKLGGEIEVKTIAGRIDLLTDKYLIEIKNYCDWKCAIGQLIAYSQNYEDRKKVMYLFDVPKKNIIDHITEICAKCDITVKIIK
uniref:KilA-N domain-containing protein n=1 Tax=viral metagenome TaxID=1070528 RepID=A0A6C0CBR9_9ZZZZ